MSVRLIIQFQSQHDGLAILKHLFPLFECMYLYHCLTVHVIQQCSISFSLEREYGSHQSTDCTDLSFVFKIEGTGVFNIE
jgi:hypothetical protein